MSSNERDSIDLPGSFEVLLAEARPRAVAVALRILRNRDDAEDAVQDAFIKAWRNRDRFEGRAAFTTWIHRIVANASLDLLRRQGARGGTATPLEEAEVAGALGTEGARSSTQDGPVSEAHSETPERHVLRVEAGQIVHRALSSLSPVHRETLTLRELEEHSYEEIASLAAIPIGTVMSRLHHARKRLAEHVLGSATAPQPERLAA